MKDIGRSLAADAAIAGAGIIGLMLGLELRRRGCSVVVIERHQAMSSASWAAGGMLAAHDPQNPPQLLPLSSLSWALYPSSLERIESLSGRHVPLRTRRTLQEIDPVRGSMGILAKAEIAEFAPGLDATGRNFEWLEEGSLDPSDLRDALPTALRAAGGTLLEGTAVLGVANTAGGVLVETQRGRISAGMFVNCCGAWAGAPQLGSLPVAPVKGQMANLSCPPERLRCVVRAQGIYLIPRGDGRVAIGSTLEHAGFDETVHEPSIRQMVQAALALLPEAKAPPQIESWAGLRPGTPDGLPILGAAKAEHCWHATGHYRDGILLAPATARVMAQAMLGEPPEVPLNVFSPARF